MDPTIPTPPDVEINFSLIDQLGTMPPGTLQPYQSATATQAPAAQPMPQPIPAAEAMPDLFIEEPTPEKPLSKKDALSMEVEPEVKVISNAPPPFNMWAADWSGLISIGTSFQKGNGENKIVDIDASTKAQWDNKDRLGMAMYYEYQDDNDIETVDEKGFSIYFDDFLTESIFLDYNARIENDDIAGIDMRSNIGISLGHQLFDTDTFKLSYALGPSYMIEETKFVTEEDTEKDISYNWKFDLEKHLKDDMAILYHNHTWLAPADETNEYIFDSHTGVRIPLKERLVATFDIEHDIDEGVPPGVSETDTKYSLKVGYEW